MAIINLNFSNLSFVYPGGYIPNPIIFESLVDNPLKYEIINKSDSSILEGRNHYKVEVAAPGFKRENLFVSIDEDCCLSITGMHTKDEIAKKQKYRKQPVKYEGFTHDIKLPANIDTDFCNAEYKFGVLSIWFPKTNRLQHRRASMIIVY